MVKERQGKNFVIAILLGVVFSMSVAFAALTGFTLEVHGTANLPDARWSVKFTEIYVSEDSTIKTLPTHTNNTITYTIDLAENTTYEFDAVISNAGTYNAKLKTLTISDIPEELESLITYEVDGIEVDDVITAGTTANLHVKVTMGTISSDALLQAVQNNKTLSLTVVAEYEQA